MPHTDSEASREAERHARHQHSASVDFRSRALVPMWDSSDPERAPPPLPLNPQSPKLTSRTGTSSAIQSAHAALNERARESANSHSSSRRPDGSPERSLVKGGTHRRMQSLQPASVRDLSWMIEQGSSRPCTPTESITSSAPPAPGPSLTPIVRPAPRRQATQSILGENTPPPSSTMLALQTMSSPVSLKEGEPLSNVTNGSRSPERSKSSIDGLSSQLASLTSIASALQKEMAALTRRSRDNATDLLSLKEATTTRDEDIRKSIRDLVGRVDDTTSRLSISSLNNLLLDNKPHPTSPQSRSIHLPRIPSPKSFAESIDRASVSTPSLAGGEASASVVLLERILRGLGTADGEDSLVGLLVQLSNKLSGMATSAKVDDLAQYVRSQTQNGLVQSAANNTRPISPSGLELDIPRGAVTQRMEHLLQNGDSRRSSAPGNRGAELLNDDLLQIIRSVKDSVAQGGGLTAEVKALVRELRGEVLGMGREIAKRLETMDSVPRGEEEPDHDRKDEVSRVIDQGLLQMKEQLNNVLREHRRQSASSSSSQKTVVDYQEIYNAMRAALRDNEATRGDMPDLSREDVIEAVRDAWEAYKPEVDVGKSALEREDIMACLKEGLQDYQPQDERPPAATRDEVFTAVVEGLKHFVPPQMDTPASMSRDEIIEAVRDCLEEFEFPVAPAALGNGNDMTHQDVVHAVKEGLSRFEVPRGGNLSDESNEEIMSRLEDIMEYMKLEFRAVSEEAKDNVAANGRDTEQVLDATKDGLENLRVSIESYVDRLSGESDKQELLDTFGRTMEEFKEDISKLVSEANDSSRSQLQSELESLREIVNTSMVPATPQGSNKDLMEALQNGINGLRQEIHRPRAETSEILDAINDGLNDLRAGIDRVTHKPADLTANDEILDALKAGLDSVRSDIETLRDNNERAVAAVPREEEDTTKAIIPMDTVKQDDIKNLEVLITQLRIKVEAMEPDAETVHKDDIARLEDMLRNVQEGVDNIHAQEAAASAKSVAEEEESTPANTDAATKEDVVAIETILRNTKDRLDDLIEGEQAVRKEHIDAISTLLTENKDSIAAFSGNLEGITRKEDVSNLEELIAQVIIGIDDLKEAAPKDVEDDERVKKSDVEAIEARVLEIKSALDGLSDMDFAAISNKEDVSGLEALIKEAKEKLDEYADTSTKALEDRQTEIAGVSERVAEVKTFLEEFQEAIQTKLDDGATGVEALGKVLETIGEKIDKNENVGDHLKEMFETMKSEFEVSKEVVAGARLESDEKLQEATDNIASKIDEKIGELIAKYDEYQAQLDEKAKVGEERNVEIGAAVVSTKTVSEELKLLVDTLGSAVTESLEKMEEASKTVFEKVEELASKSGEAETGGKQEHQQTRDQVQAAVSAVEGLQGELKEYQPQILEAVKDILLLVGEHYEHSKSSASDIQEKIVDVKPFDQAMLPPPPEKYDDSEVKEKLNLLADQKYDDTEIREKLDRLAEQKFDDSALHEKLDQLTDHHASTVAAFAQFETLDKVHKTVTDNAAQLSEYISVQTKRIADDHEDREKTLQDTCLAVERKLAEQEHLTASVASLQEEEDRMRQSVLSLRTEQESLIRQRTRLTGDVSSLETALRLRKEELAEMEARAERLERRIVEGVMDHSRVLLMNKSASSARDSMNRKRVKKPAAADGEAKSSPRPAAVNMALSTRRSLAPTTQNGAGRRIASLSQMTPSNSSASVRRSQSVRTPGGASAHRKRSWGGGLGKEFGIEDKENVCVDEILEEASEVDSRSVSRELALQGRNSFAGTELSSLVDSAREEDEDEAREEAEDEARDEDEEEEAEAEEEEGEEEDEADDGRSDADTMRRTSGGTTIVSSSDVYTESDMYSDYSDTASEWTSLVAGGRSSIGAAEGNELTLHNDGN
ncbi:chromosome segregation ATPase family protein [Cordyceps fumosorosea ARSEF 2679]|uniref:Chromosome segregation ATPase family protein n=1 Tax=Cordyceps fumosorosea (strain ARSEF 2679) TaxID=1081104 RepID=A0A167MY74_CORFA|nr:chromosome segregation ATPase family protein [Cordyceps fumosorosea ARSEF 2679]OAA54894.1 chromosome segregation ATPase family protein [Cordyceps fumosorosea ARSEF 2679]